MSIELRVFTPIVQLPEPATLAKDAEAVGWRLSIVTDVQQMLPARTLSDCTVVGCETDTAAADFALLLASSDSQRVQGAYQEEAIALVELSAHQPAAPTHEELHEWHRVGVQDSLLQRLQKARTCFVVRTSANRNELSAELQRQLWLLLGVLTDGVCVDDAEGEVIDAAESS